MSSSWPRTSGSSWAASTHACGAGGRALMSSARRCSSYAVIGFSVNSTGEPPGFFPRRSREVWTGSGRFCWRSCPTGSRARSRSSGSSRRGRRRRSRISRQFSVSSAIASWTAKASSSVSILSSTPPGMSSGSTISSREPARRRSMQSRRVSCPTRDEGLVVTELAEVLVRPRRPPGRPPLRLPDAGGTPGSGGVDVARESRDELAPGVLVAASAARDDLGIGERRKLHSIGMKQKSAAGGKIPGRSSVL